MGMLLIVLDLSNVDGGVTGVVEKTEIQPLLAVGFEKGWILPGVDWRLCRSYKSQLMAFVPDARSK